VRRIAGLDLLRGIAILLVMLRHAVPDVFPGAAWPAWSCSSR